MKIKLVKSLNGRKKDQIATAYSLGLKKIGNETIQPDNEATRKTRRCEYHEVARAFSGAWFE